MSTPSRTYYISCNRLQPRLSLPILWSLGVYLMSGLRNSWCLPALHLSSGCKHTIPYVRPSVGIVRAGSVMCSAVIFRSSIANEPFYALDEYSDSHYCCCRVNTRLEAINRHGTPKLQYNTGTRVGIDSTYTPAARYCWVSWIPTDTKRLSKCSPYRTEGSIHRVRTSVPSFAAHSFS